jgi:hypothetical protein
MFDITHVFPILMFDITHVSPILMFDNIRYYTCVIYLDFAPLLLHFVLPLAFILWQSILLVEEPRVPGENHRPAASH